MDNFLIQHDDLVLQVDFHGLADLGVDQVVVRTDDKLRGIAQLAHSIVRAALCFAAYVK